MKSSRLTTEERPTSQNELVNGYYDESDDKSLYSFLDEQDRLKEERLLDEVARTGLVRVY